MARGEIEPKERYDHEQSNAILYWLQYPYSASEPELPPIFFARIKELGLRSPIELLSRLPMFDELSRQAAMVYCAGFPMGMIQQQSELNEALHTLLDTLKSQSKSSVLPTSKMVSSELIDARTLRRERIFRNALDIPFASIAEVGRTAYSGTVQALEWQEDALCAQTDPELFFPEKGGSTREAKAVCFSCEVRSECLGYALENNERFGIWGGLSERERRKLKKRAE